MEYRPTSYITNQVMLWYDALYRASEAIDTYSVPQAPILTTVAQKQDYIWGIILTMTVTQADDMLKVLTKDNKKR